MEAEACHVSYKWSLLIDPQFASLQDGDKNQVLDLCPFPPCHLRK